MLCQQADKLEAYLETCNRIAAYADEDGGYENLLDSAVFEDAQVQLQRDLMAATVAAAAFSEATPQPSFDEDGSSLNGDFSDRNSLASDLVSRVHL